jgi:hypothetical protein
MLSCARPVRPPDLMHRERYTDAYLLLRRLEPVLKADSEWTG